MARVRKEKSNKSYAGRQGIRMNADRGREDVPCIYTSL